MAFTIIAGNDKLTLAFYDKLKTDFIKKRFDAFDTDGKSSLKMKIELTQAPEQLIVGLSAKRVPDETEFAMLRTQLAETVYQFVEKQMTVDYLEEKLFWGYDELTLTEKEQIWSILNREKNKYWEYAKARNVLASFPDLLFEYFNQLESSAHLNIQGFLRFRIPEYFPLLDKTIEHAIDRFMIEKEYETFIELIQAFILTQKSRINVVHVVWSQNHCFQLLDEQHLPLKQDWWQQGDGIAMEGAYDDVLITSLLYLLPEKIILHTGCEAEAPKIALTVQRIFSGRTILCAGCKVCRGVLEQSKK